MQVASKPGLGDLQGSVKARFRKPHFIMQIENSSGSVFKKQQQQIFFVFYESAGSRCWCAGLDPTCFWLEQPLLKCQM